MPIAQDADSQGLAQRLRQAQGAPQPSSLAEKLRSAAEKPAPQEELPKVEAVAPVAVDPKTEELKGIDIGQSLWRSAEFFAERLLMKPAGQLSAAASVAEAETRPAGWQDVPSLLKSFASISLPGISGDKATVADLDKVASTNADFSKVWQALKKTQQDSIALGNETTRKGKVKSEFYPGIGKVPFSVYDQNAFAELAKHGDIANQPRIELVPGYSRPPISNEELAQVGYDMLAARTAADIEKLPSWVRAGLSGAAVGGPLAVAQRLTPGGMVGGAVLGTLFELGRQLLAKASDPRQEMQPGQVLLSAALFTSGATWAEKAKRALPMIPRVATFAGSLIPFEAMAAGRAALEFAKSQQQPKPVAGAKPVITNEPSAWRKLIDHMVEGAATVLSGVAVSHAFDVKPTGLPTDYKATEETAARLKSSLLEAVHVRENAPTPKTVEKDVAINDEWVPAHARLMKARDQLDKEIEKASGGDEKLRSEIEKWSRVVVESQGRIPIPEGTPIPASMPRIIELTKQFGDAALKIGDLLAKHGVVPTGEGSTYKAATDEGFFFPRTIVGKEHGAPPSPQAAPSATSGRAPLASAELRSHLMERRLTFDEAFQKYPLDLSLAKAYNILTQEITGGERFSWLDLSKADKTLITEAELPDMVGKAQMKERAKAIDGMIDALRAREGTVSPQDQLILSRQIRALGAERDALIQASEGKYYVKLKGKKWGPYEGQYLARDELSRINSLDQNHGALVHLLRELNSIYKQMRAGMNIKAWIGDKIGNSETFGEAGINILGHNGPSIAKNLGFAQKNDIDYEFDVMAKKASLGGPSDVTRTDLMEASQIGRQIHELEEAGQKATGLKLVQILARREELLAKADKLLTQKSPFGIASIPTKALRGLLWIPRGRQLVIDLADSRSAYHVLREKGSGDSGPLPPGKAFQEVRGVMDYRMLPKWVQRGSGFFTWWRYPMKWIQSTIIRNAKQKPSFFGKTISTPMDTVIGASPGSPEADRKSVV